jgi:hypothetical protein
MFQPGLGFDLPATLTCVVTVSHRRLVARWPALGIRATFRDWPALLEAVLHPLNAHVRLRVRGPRKYAHTLRTHTDC